MNTQELLNTSAIVGHNSAANAVKLTDAQKEAIAKSMDSLATKLADVVDDAVNQLVVNIENSKKEVAVGPFRIMRWAMDSIAPDKLAEFPTPGTDYSTSQVPDKYEEVYYSNGKKKFRQTSFYLKFFLTCFPEGKRIAAALQHVSLAADEKANQAAVPEEIRKLDPVSLESLKQDLISKQTSGVKAIRDAFSLMKQFEAVNNLPGVTAEPMLDKEGNVQRVQKPIHVFNPENPKNEWQLYSISGFMQFDPAKAAEIGGTFDALKLTAKREQAEEDENDPATSDKPVVINTNATFVARINDLAEFVSNKLMAAGDKKRELYTQFLKNHVNGPGSDDLIYNLNEIKLLLDGVMGIPAVQTRLEQVNRKRNAA